MDPEEAVEEREKGLMPIPPAKSDVATPGSKGAKD